MIVIVEGIDRVGKSTLVDRIHRNINFPVYNHVSIGSRNFDVIKNAEETDKFLQVIEVCNLSHANIIFDRFYMSDFVYGCIQRHYDFTEALKNKDEIEMRLRKLDALLILVKPVNIEESSLQHGRDLSRHKRLFDFLYEESKLLKMEVTYDSLYKAEKWVKEQFNHFMNNGGYNYVR